MRFDDCDEPLTEPEIKAVESSLGLELPKPLRDNYLRCNGGAPEPYCYEDDNIDTVVTMFLPLESTRRETAVATYRDLVLTKGIVPRNFFPFAAEGGGDYFFVDTSSPDGKVYLYRHDTAYEDERLVPLNLGVEEFWEQLKDE